jgi:UDP-2,3-diacylglucosamine pyrophosphatase LpxH
MKTFQILVADDEQELQESIYRRLLDDTPDFQWEPVWNRSEYEATAFENYDAILLDINLTKWGMPLTDAVRCIGGRAPIVLVSGKWDGNDGKTTIARTEEALAQSKDAHFVQILILNDLLDEHWQRRVDATRAQLRLAIARHHRRGVLQLGDSDPVHILHLSDPQYGDPLTDGWASLAEDELAEYVYGIRPDIQFVAITGDISYQGLPTEYDVALNRLRPLLQKLLRRHADWREQVILVPGNHDANLRLAAVDNIRYDFASRVPKLTRTESDTDDSAHFSLQPFREFAWNLTGDPHWREADDLCWVNDAFRHLGLRFYLLNSAGEINCTNPDRAAIPVEAVRRLAQDKARSESLFPIAFSHHGPPDGNENEVSIANWPDVAKLMQTKGIRMFVHGHGHQREFVRQAWEAPGARMNAGELSDKEFLRIMAPTTHLDNKLRPNGARRGFNIITLNRKRGSVNHVVVSTYELGIGKPERCDREEFYV